MNYSELQQALQDYLQTSETTFVANIPLFVRQAEERINRAVIIPRQRQTDTGTMTSGNRYLQKPSGFLSGFSINYIDGNGEAQFLLLKDENFIREAYPDASATGAPAYYAHFDNEYWTLGPTPDSDYVVYVRYYVDPESIVTAGTSWLGDNAESALLYGCLVEAYTFQKGDADLIKLYKTRYEEALADMVRLGLVQSKRDDYREGEVRISA